MLNKNNIVDAQDMTKEKVMVPEWGAPGQEADAFVYVASLTGTQRDDFEAKILTTKGKDVSVNMKNMRATLLVLTITDEAGVRVFADNETDLIGAKNAEVVDRLFAVSQRLSGLRKEDVEELTKNS